MLLHHAFEAAAQRLPGKTAVVCGARRISYEELLGRVLHLAALLRCDGVQPGDRVVLLLEGDIDYVIAVHAVLRAGAVMVPLSAMTKADKLAFVLEDTEATALLADTRLSDVWSTARVRCPRLRTIRTAAEFDVDVDAGVDAGAAASVVERIDQDLAALIYTSGSTGKPKGVMLTHRNMTSAWASVQAYLSLREDDVVGLALPPTYSYGLYHVLMALGLGARLVLERQAAFPIKVAQTLERERITVFPGVPTLFASLLDLPQLGSHDHSALRLLSNAAASLAVTQVQRIRRAWPHATLYSMYGMTECKRISYLPPSELDSRPGSVGRGMPNQEHWLVDEEGQRLAAGGIGELVVRGSHVMRGYWKRPDETASRLRPGAIAGESVLHTGDLFRADEQGFLYFVSRMDDIIKTRGEKVAPREVEEVIHQLSGVTGCAVIGVADAALGEAVKAYVKLVPGTSMSAREVIRHCIARLESHMVPRSVDFVDELPTTESGKVRHASLRGR